MILHCRPLTLIIPMLLASAACAPWVKLTAEGADVRHLSRQAAVNCTEVGRVSAVTREKVVGVGRNDDSVQAELLTMARNEAAALGADAVVATSGIADGRQTFDALRCED